MLAQYQQLLDQQVLCEDKAQQQAIFALAELSKQLVCSSKSVHQRKFFNKFLPTKTNPAIKGLYFYGRVGRGKTMLMDLFYQNTAIKNKKRIHFHRFMEDVHQQLNSLSLKKDALDEPLARIARAWAKDIKLLCFDEFFVSDIGDAMLLSGLFKELFLQGVTLVTTSNCQPEQLYRNGLQRERFLPTITLIKEHCQIMSIDGDIDHRLNNGVVHRHQNYYLRHLDGERHLAERFQGLCSDKIPDTKNATCKSIIINQREMYCIAKTDKHIWFDFFALCSGPRSQRDYIQLADLFDTVLISNVPQFTGELVPAVFSGVEDRYQRSGILMANLRQLDDEARRFIALVDEFYDRKIQLIISADVDITELYQGQQLAFEFQRCQSRLFEMQKSH